MLQVYVLSCTALIVSTSVLSVQKSTLISELKRCENETGELTTMPPTPIDPEGYRLPSHIKPDSYNLSLSPNLKDGTFKGEVDIKVNVREDSSEMRIHSKGLTIKSVSIDGKSANFTENTAYEVLIIKLRQGMISKGLRDVRIVYEGDMKNRIVGLYASSYPGKDGSKIPIATSKFEPTYARQAFPCFDEPNMKAKYTVNILRPNVDNYIALSNMPQKGETPTENGVMVHFAESKYMSTYLSCFIVCDFISNNGVIKSEGGELIPLRVFSTPAQINKTAFALDVGSSVMEYFIKYFGIPYPLPKLDLIAIPDFISGAMEHWGLVTFRETALLFDNKISSAKNMQRVASVIAHELAHSWFGNLVTMNWWNDLWLNEGFASYIQFKGVNFRFKDWQMMDQFLIDTLHSVMSTDATPASHPIVKTVETPDQITEIFDAITYNKGASVLRMLDHAISEKVFQKGVTNYLLAHKWGNAVTQDLWDELQKLVPETTNITDIMSTWTVQMGYPIVTVNENNDTYVLTQKRFLKDYSKPGNVSSIYGYKWSIPITYITDKGISQTNTIWFKHDQSNLKIKKPEGIRWIKFNHNQVGYYRVNYSPAYWNVLAKNIKDMTISDKTHLIEESFSIAESGDLSYSIPLELTKYLENETNYIPWSVASSKLGGLKKYLVDTLDFPHYSRYMLNLVEPAYVALGWNEKPEDSHLTRRARVIILNFACENGHAECLKVAKTKFLSWLNDPANNPLSQNLRGIIYYHGLKNAGQEEWFKLLELLKKEIDANEKLNMLHALAGVKEAWLLHHLIQLGTIEGQNQVIRGQDYFTVLQSIAENPIGTALVWNYVRENWPYLVKRFTLNDRFLGRLIPEITKTFTTKIKLDEMESFFAIYPNAGAGTAAREQALATVNNNIKWISKNRDDVVKWMRQQNSASHES
ncbi:glutamyl aminopeptidase-like isoform X3 [Photinus pyralis]|uniref:glutamyl aminopeptidase-like isoform X3 n=1 Tax=Photinus pyralis TaxID=7054 RepID=UPI001266FACD|nr:glutamyl aminopeptidase-like isoform X3 [Photinus pyralis]